MKYYIATKQEFYNQGYAYGFVEQDEQCDCATSFKKDLEFDNLKDAKEWVAENDEDVYYTSHNEVGRWELRILDEDEAYRFAQTLLHENMGGNEYDWEHCDNPEEPTDEEIATACAAVEDAAWEDMEVAE